MTAAVHPDYADTVSISRATAAELSKLGLGDFAVCETPQRMAWVVLVLREIADTDERFPRGKWATIQHIEGQIHRCAVRAAHDLERDLDGEVRP